MLCLNYNNFEKIVKKINDTDKSIDEIKKIILQKDMDTKNNLIIKKILKI